LYSNTTGTNNTANGYYSLYYNESNSNSSLGSLSFNEFNEDNSSEKTFANTDIIVDGDTIYISGHGFGSVGDIRLLKWTATTGTLPAGITLNQIDQFEIIHADTIVLITDDMTSQGTGNQTLTPQYIYTNSTALGYDAEPDASNQIVLGNENVTEIKTTASYTSTDSVTTIGLMPNCRKLATLADDATWTFFSGVCGIGTILTNDGATFAQFRFTSAGAVTLIQNTSDVDNADTDAKLCIYDGGTAIVIKNRLGSTQKLSIDINYYTP